MNPREGAARGQKWFWIRIMVMALLVPATVHATFPGKNGRIAFHDEITGGIYTIKPNGGQRRMITPDGFEPAWSPNGRRIVFARLDSGMGSTQLVVMGATGKHKRVVISDPEPVLWEPSWSPDGRRIVYRKGFARSTGGDLYTVRLDGSDARLLTTHGENPDWSAAGVAFADFPAPARCYGTEIFRINPDGAGRTLLPFGCNGSFHPSWHPDGRRLAFASYTTGGPPELTDIYVGDADGVSRARLTDLPDYEFEPCWSPRGDKIVFVNSRVEGDFLTSQGLFLVDPENPLAVTPIPNTAEVHAGRPDWQPR